MAVTLTIDLNDQEQARLLEIASLVQPNATPLEVKAWAEKQAKQGLREAVSQAWQNYQVSAMEADWPVDLEPPPEEQPPEEQP